MKCQKNQNHPLNKFLQSPEQKNPVLLLRKDCHCVMHVYQKKIYIMKKLFLFIVLAVSVTALSGQRSVDELFDKYAGRDGFTTVTFNGSLLKLFCNSENEGEDAMPANITELRILAQDDHTGNVENFYDQVIKGIDLDKYEEFMKIKDSGQDVRMLVRIDGKVFREFLLIAGGDDNAIIQLKGRMTLGEAKKFSENARKNHGSDIIEDHK